MAGRGGRGGVTQELMRDNMEDLGIDNKPGAMDDGSGGGDLFPPPLNRPSHSSVAAKDELFCMQKMEEMTRRFQASAYHLQYKDNKTDIARYSDKIRLAAAAGQRTVLECINALGPTKDAYFSQELLDGLMGKNSTVPKRGVGGGVAGANSSKSMASGKSGRKEGGAAGAGAEGGSLLLSKLADGSIGAGGDRRRKRANSHTAHTLERLSQRERASGGPKDAETIAAKKARAGSIDSGAGGSVMEEDEEEVENDDDYIVDHYGSDDGGGDDDGGDDEPFY